jgi:hypothetical protein
MRITDTLGSSYRGRGILRTSTEYRGSIQKTASHADYHTRCLPSAPGSKLLLKVGVTSLQNLDQNDSKAETVLHMVILSDFTCLLCGYASVINVLYDFKRSRVSPIFIPLPHQVLQIPKLVSNVSESFVRCSGNAPTSCIVSPLRLHCFISSTRLYTGNRRPGAHRQRISDTPVRH